MNKEVLTNKEVSDALHCLFHCARKDSNYETQYQQFRLVYDYINQLESTLNEITDWKDKNGNRYIYQDSLGEDWYFYDLDVFDELGEILNKVGDSNE